MATRSINKVLSGGDMSQASLTSPVVSLLTTDDVGLQLIWTGTPTGTFDVQVSCDNANWTSVTLSPAPAAAGSASNAYVDLSLLSAPYMRVVYTKTSGTGSLTIYLAAKELGS